MQAASQTSLTHQTATGIEHRIRDYISRELLFSEDGFPHSDSASFLEEGVIDSLGIIELVTFTGREFGIQVEPAEVIPQNFDSVERLAAYVRKKQGVVQAQASVGS